MTHYETLQVSRDAEAEVIEKAYRALSMKHHPDRADESGRDRATRRMQRINEAYDVLSDPAKRVRYDRTLPSGDGAAGWERFWEEGLVGLFSDWLRSQP